MSLYQEVLFEEISGTGGNLGLMTLNRVDVLNSLNHAMVQAMYAQLQTWATADHIKAVVIKAAEGRAFCAGGDLRLTYERCKAKNGPSMSGFFRDEYHLNRCIFHYPKPYIALLDGITMGGGVGISMHGSHRVATDRLLFAMPETGIGFFPDVGGTYFLPRLVGKVGFYLGLTGARIASDDCVALGIAEQKVAREDLPILIQALAKQAFRDNAKATVSHVIEQFKVASQPSPLTLQQTVIDDCFSATTVENIVLQLQQSNSQIGKDAVIAMAKKSPSSLKITLLALQRGKNLDFDACMRDEYRLVSRFLEGHDFIEGIRALIIDKDQKPKWDPSRLEEVKPSLIEKYFSPLNEELF